MSLSLVRRLRWAALALGAEALHLAWEAMHGGIMTHHLMQRSDWPGLSNAWGLLVVPALAAWAAGRWAGGAAQRREVAWGGLVALAWGLALSTAFAWPWPAATEALFFGLLLAALAWPVHRAECLLGWMLGMSWTFGALMPTAIGAVLMLLSWGVRGVALRAYRWARPH